MGELVFIVLILICMGLIYLVHRYYGKEQFYLLMVIYAIASFMMSFRVTRVFGLDINMGLIFGSGLLGILYYFINKYDKKEIKNLLVILMISILGIELFLTINSLMLPSVYDSASFDYQNIVFNNLPMMILYPVATLITFILSSYCFVELKKEKKNRLQKNLVTMIGIVFIDTFIFIYFSYAFIINFEEAIYIALGNYFVKMLWCLLVIIITDKIIGVKKVKE